MKVNAFNEERKRLTELALDKANLSVKRFYGLDTSTYAEGVLDVKPN